MTAPVAGSCKFTPMEFETPLSVQRQFIKAMCKFTPMEFETSSSSAGLSAGLV